MNYRREVDGLRAMAVIPVMLFHAGFSWISGGFVGVDVFFVISGYLITSIIVAERQRGVFSIARFYERRARRILPALFLVMLACLPFAWRWMLPDQLKEFSDGIAAVCLFVSNLLFYNQVGYFDTAAEVNPLLHIWSLAVEEQYYLVFPPFVMLMWKFGRRTLTSAVCAILGISLFLAQFGGNFSFHYPFLPQSWHFWNSPDWAFFLAPTRAWELAIGALVALYLGSRRNASVAGGADGAFGQSMAALGIALITWGAVRFDQFTPFPSFYALMPTVGAALVLVYATEDTVVGRLLGHRWLVTMGLISYGAYLWHQPLLAFARIRSTSHLSALALLPLLVLATLLAYLTWRYVEVPFRDREKVSVRAIVVFSSTVTAAFLGAGMLGHFGAGFPQRIPVDIARSVEPVAGWGISCRPIDVHTLPKNIRACEFGDLDGKESWALYGDSHADALLGALDEALKARRIRGIRVHNQVCQVVPRFYMAGRNVDPGACATAQQALLGFMQRETNTVVVAIRWTFWSYPVPGEIDRMEFDNGEGGVEMKAYTETVALQDGVMRRTAAAKSAAIRDLIQSLATTQRRVVVFYPVPEVGWDPRRLNYNSWLSDGAAPTSVSTSYARYKERNRFVVDTLDSLGARPNLVRVAPSNLLCNSMVKGRCVVQVDRVPLYADDDHLSLEGSRMVVSELFRALTASRSNAG